MLDDMPEPIKTFARNFFTCSSVHPRTLEDLPNDGMVVWFDIVDNWGNDIDIINQMVKDYNKEIKETK